MLPIVVISIGVLGSALLVGITVARLRSKEVVLYHFAFYAALGLGLNIILLWQALSPGGGTYDWLPQLLLLLINLVFGSLTLHFLNKPRRILINYGGAALGVVLLWGIFALNL